MLVYDVKRGIVFNTKNIIFEITDHFISIETNKRSKTIGFSSNEEAKAFIDDMLRAETAGCAVYRVEAHASDPVSIQQSEKEKQAIADISLIADYVVAYYSRTGIKVLHQEAIEVLFLTQSSADFEIIKSIAVPFVVKARNLFTMTGHVSVTADRVINL